MSVGRVRYFQPPLWVFTQAVTPTRNARPTSLASQPSLSITVLSKCGLLQDKFPDNPQLEAHPEPFESVCPHPEGGDSGLFPSTEYALPSDAFWPREHWG